MGKPIRSNNINENYDLYENLLKSSKKLLSPIISINRERDQDKNHTGSLKRKVPVLINSEENCCLEVIVKDNNRERFNFIIDHEISKPFYAVRFDSSGGTHKNNLPDIPLKEQSVKTPHFHKFRSDGFEIAYRTEELIENESNLSLNKMFPIFCKEFNIIHPNREDVNISIEGELKFDEIDYDPHENITFEL